MITTTLTVVMAIALLGGLFAASVTAVYRHRLVPACAFAASEFAVLHLVLVMSAQEVAKEVPSSLSAVFNVPAWMAIAFFTIAMVMVIVGKARQRRS